MHCAVEERCHMQLHGEFTALSVEKQKSVIGAMAQRPRPAQPATQPNCGASGAIIPDDRGPPSL